MFEVVPLGWLCWRNFFWMAALQGRVVCGGGMEFVLTRGLSTPGRRRYHARALISWPIPQVWYVHKQTSLAADVLMSFTLFFSDFNDVHLCAN